MKYIIEYKYPCPKCKKDVTPEDHPSENLDGNLVILSFCPNCSILLNRTQLAEGVKE